MHPYSLNAFYGCSLQQRLQLALRLFADYGEQLLSLSALQNYLNLLLLLQNEVHLCMAESDIPAFCRVCAQTNLTGGCCSHAMTDENDAVLLLINLLAGVPVQIQRSEGTECLFLGSAGCSLLFKPFFCLNYLCGKLQHGIPQSTARKLAKASGLLLQEQYAAEQFLLGILKSFFTDGSEKGIL